MSLLTKLDIQIGNKFNENPYRFFSEHDIHTELAKILIDELESENSLWSVTKDEKKVTRVHHEYPTPFRCYMKGTSFQKYTENQFKKAKEKTPSLRVRRGHFDIVVFNEEYIQQNDLQTVSGKNYRALLKSFNVEQPTALELAIEVVYHISLDSKPHFGIMKRRKDSTEQDYKKLKALMNFTFKDDTPFCQESAMMFFSNSLYNDTMKKRIEEIKRTKKVQLFSYYS